MYLYSIVTLMYIDVVVERGSYVELRSRASEREKSLCVDPPVCQEGEDIIYTV